MCMRGAHQSAGSVGGAIPARCTGGPRRGVLPVYGANGERCSDQLPPPYARRARCYISPRVRREEFVCDCGLGAVHT